jgi:biopolymer transport protein ExbB/TolQ
LDNALKHYVLDGGWAMLLLIPASVLAVGIVLRNLWTLRWSALEDKASELETSQGDRAMPSSMADDVVEREVLKLCSYVQPLSALFVLAPLAGLLGSLVQLSALFERIEGGLAVSQSQAAVIFRGALLPAIWGALLSAFCYAWYAVFRSRILSAEEELFHGTAEQTVVSRTPRRQA